MASPNAVRAVADPSIEEVVALHECLVRLLERRGLEELFHEIVDRAAALARTEHACLYLLDGRKEALTLRVGAGAFARDGGRRHAPDSGLAGRVLERRRTIVVDDYRRWESRRPALAEEGVRATVGVPISDGTGIVGVLGLAYTDSRRFDARQLRTLERFAQLTSLALENARLLDDARTELRERRTAEEELVDVVARLRRSEHELQRSQEETITRLANAAESRSAETGRHVQRMSIWCARLARHLGLDDDVSELIRRASPLHDIGKLAIPDRILLKPGPLTPAERRVIETHAEIGHELLKDSSMELLDLAASIAWTHHERFDGKGYPRGLVGAAIPLEGRIAAVADVFDALTSDRAYRPAMASAEAVEIVRAGRGSAFDPVIVDAFLELVDDADVAAAETAPHAPAPARHDRRRPRRLTERSLAAAVDAALAALATGSGRPAIDAALAALTAANPSLLVSVYALEHDRLWCVSQCGYARVRDGFGLDQGIIGRTARTGEVQFIRDISGDPDFLEAVDGIDSELAFPLHHSDGVAGVVNLETHGARLPDGAVEAFAPLAAGLEHALATVDDVAEIDLAHLARLCVYASSLRGVPAISEFAARTTGRLLDLNSAQVNLAGRGNLRLAAYWSRTSDTRAPFTGDRLAELSETAPDTVAFNTFQDPADEDGWEVVWLPLRSGGTTVGAIVGRRRDDETLAHERVEAATLFGQHVAALLDVAQALRRERRAATTDALTALLNRRGFDLRLREELEHAEAAREPLSMLLVDCDRLKALNDAHGHERGDRFLQAVADAIRVRKRADDAAARLGGDEFAILLPHTDAAGAALLGERLLDEVARTAGTASSATISVGVASTPPFSADELLRAADAALYAAKTAGGARVHVG
ncbi:MAG TPA: HD domain-containing phosphohydrolase [Gaiellaceae bacterium]|nr:HD domain-containing phosphohydrolase [Gaiellaceae bacterium]